MPTTEAPAYLRPEGLHVLQPKIDTIAVPDELVSQRLIVESVEIGYQSEHEGVIPDRRRCSIVVEYVPSGKIIAPETFTLWLSRIEIPHTIVFAGGIALYLAEMLADQLGVAVQVTVQRFAGIALDEAIAVFDPSGTRKAMQL